MAERRRAGARRKENTVTLVRDHRTNDSVLGHVGRLTYTSPVQRADEGAGIGTLITNRATGKTHHWKEVKPFQELDNTLTTDTPEASAASPLHPREYIKWLLQSAPEALEGIAGPPCNDTIETVRAANLKQPCARLPILAHGEITDSRHGERKSCQVLAMAAGDSGHALRIVRVTPQDWAWAASGNVFLELAGIDDHDQGYWCGNALAITQIKFVSDNPAKPMSRWLLVQTATETLLFEPTLGLVPILDKSLACLDANRGPFYISMDIKIRIPMSETGGRMHCDASFNPATSKLPPQLAIVDDGGNWSVWDISGDRHIRKPVLSAVLRAKGSMEDGIGPSPHTSGLGHLNRIVWLPPPRRPDPEAAAEAAHQEDKQSQTLLLGNAASVNLVSIEHKKPMLKLNTVHSGSLDVVVDIQISPANPAHIFVLTTVAIFWFDLSHISNYASPKSTPGVPTQPLLLLSCPHLRNPMDRTMKLCLFPVKSPNTPAAVAAIVYSIKHPEAVVFRFANLAPGPGATYEQQPLRFSHPQDGPLLTPDHAKTTPRFRGQQTLLVFPTEPRACALSKVEEENFGRAYIHDGVGFFQIISLQPDLSLQWSLYSCSPPHASSAVVAPFPRIKKKSHNPARKVQKKRFDIVDYFANRFVVPDDFEDEIVSEKGLRKNPRKALPAPPPEPVSHGISRTTRGASDTEASENQTGREKKTEVYSMSRLFNLLDGRLEEAAAEAFESTDAPRGFQTPSPLDMIRPIIEIAAQHGSFAYTTLLNIANADYLKEFGADLTDLSWTSRLSELGTIEERRVTIFDQLRGERLSQEYCNKGLSTLYEVLGRLCAISLERDDRERYSDDRFVRRQGLLAYMAVRLFFSQISMVIMPRQVTYTTSGRTTPAFETGQSALPTPYSAPPARTLHDSILSSSPMKPSVPNWLLSSSQEYGVQDDRHGADDTDEYVLPSRELDDQQDDAETGADTPRNNNDNNDIGAGEEEDPVIGRLRQFAKAIKSEPPRADGELRLLTHWQLGSDPAEFHWVPLGAAGEAEEEMRRQAQEAREKKQRKLEKRAARDRERLLSMGVGMGVGTGSGGAAGYLPSSQPMSSQLASQLPIQLPNHLYYHSQAQAPGSSPVVKSSQVFSSQVMPSSQPVIHTGAAFSQRPKKKKKKPTTARGFK